MKIRSTAYLMCVIFCYTDILRLSDPGSQSLANQNQTISRYGAAGLSDFWQLLDEGLNIWGRLIVWRDHFGECCDNQHRYKY
jgi:hypothetical protein